MINRSTIKYTLKKILPKMLFTLVLTVWQKHLLKIVEKIDTLRLKNFTTYRCVKIVHRKKEFALYISPSNGFIDRHIYLYGAYEPFILDLLSLHLTSGDTFVDIGANIGQHSMYAATLVGETGHVHAFEPIPVLCKQIQDSVQKNHFEHIVTVHNTALGNNDTFEKLFISKNKGGSSLVNNDETQDIITVHIQQGDVVLSKLKNITVIKIDVEGYEYEVLRGIEQTLLTKNPTLFLEFSGEFYLKQHNNHGEKILALLRACNYSLYDIEDAMKCIVDDTLFNTVISQKRKQTNLLCIKQSHDKI